MNLASFFQSAFSDEPDSPDEEQRVHRRKSQFAPVLLAPWKNGEALAEEAIYGLTRDVSPVGIGVIVTQPLEINEVACGFHIDTPFFLQGEIRSRTDLGGGFHQLGVRMWRAIKRDDVALLLPMAEKLLPGVSSEESHAAMNELIGARG